MNGYLRAAARRWLRGPLHVWYHPSYRLPLASSMGAPMSPRRADDALTWALDAKLLTDAQIHEPRELSWDDAGLVHTEPYLASLDQTRTVAHILGTDEARVPVPEILETWRRASGGTVASCQHVLQHGGRALNLLGGFHHAEPDKGGGFCALNDVAIAVAAARRDGFRGTIGIIDLDAHPPDGLAACLRNDEHLVIHSIAVASHWEVMVPERARLLDLRIEPGTEDAGYLAAVDKILAVLPACQLVFYLAGADPLVKDPLGGLSVSESGLFERDRRVLAQLARTPTVILPAGGYREESWRVLAGTMAAAAGVSTRVSPTFDPLQHRTRRVMATLDPRTLGREQESTRGEEALLTEEELFGSLMAAPHTGEVRFLGYYTRHGLEYALEAYGYLTTLRRLGFSDLEIELSTGSQSPDRMLITAAAATGRQTLVDLAASIRPLETKGAPSVRTLFIEWLELKDPRVDFTNTRPKLPGQQRPGLGLADETMQLLVRAAERLELAGVSFIPSHYHVAWMARSRFVVVDPLLRARFRAMVRAVSALPLDRASQLLGGPGLGTEDGEVLRWQPTEMVIPLDPALGQWLADGESSVKQAEEALYDRILLPINTSPASARGQA